MTKYDELYKISEVTKMLRISRSTLYRWMDQGLISYIELPNGQRRITKSEVDKIFNQEKNVV